jgi:hypothetical protein
MTTCDRCYRDASVGEHGLNLCPLEPRRANAVIGDDIPGGVEIIHGICNEDGSPRRYYSKSEMARVAKERGLTNMVRHVGTPGTDKSKHTIRWV